MSQQEGFIDLIHESAKDHEDCVNVVVKFKDKSTLYQWGESAAHDALVDELNMHRSRNYWEAAVAENELADYEAVSWEKIICPIQSPGR